MTYRSTGRNEELNAAGASIGGKCLSYEATTRRLQEPPTANFSIGQGDTGARARDQIGFRRSGLAWLGAITAAFLITGTSSSNAAQGVDAQKLPPYNNMRELFYEHALLLSNPLTAGEAEEKLRQRGVSQMTAFVAGFTEESSSWLVQLAAEVGPAVTPGKGFFCRVSIDDAESMARLRLVSAIRPGIVISGELAEYNVDLPNGVMSIVLDPCQIVDLPPQ
ncbi:hypothetical protein [Mesorhizobium sp. M0029]|uniref:hypothetical protein n=1 Tax=Mesorhizobium sp. M0029 TaxID=2956850 RepID=UPI003338005A